MSSTSVLINQAVNVLIGSDMKKTGCHIVFSGYQDLRVEEIEMLEFLFQFEGSMEKFEELAQKNKGSNANTPIWKLMYHFHNIHNFGFLNCNKVETSDTISDMSQIEMKPRHVVYLDILKAIKPNIEELFIFAYNQIQPSLNPFRVEQVFFYLREYLEYEGINSQYSDFKAAVPHLFTGDWVPYFSNSNYGYFVIDNLFGGYSGSLYITAVDKGEKPQWYYGSSRGCDRWHGQESTAIAEVEELRGLNAIAGIEGLDWEIIFANRHDVPERTGYHSLFKDIPKGKIMLHRKLEKEITKPKLSKRSA